MARRAALTLLALVACRGGKAEVAAAADDGGSGRGVLVGERAPHPDYPTPALAGTEELFLLEEPPRGPHITDVKLPERSELHFTVHPYCELTASRLICAASHAKPGAPLARWNVGRNAGERVVLAERLGPSGKLLETVLFDWDQATGKLRRLTDFEEHGMVEWVRTFNPPGERFMERSLTGANDLPGCGFMAVTRAPGRTETDCLQWNGNPMRDTNGVAVTQYRTDAQGFTVERVRLGIEHKPVAGHDGVHKTIYQRDAAGRVTFELNLGLDGKPVLSTSEGCAGHKRDYDERGLELRDTCLGRDGLPARSEEGVAVTSSEHNDDGCVTSRKSFDRDGKPTHVRGVYGVLIENDATCRELSTTCIGADAKPVACGPGEPARYDYERDDRGRVVAIKHREPDGDPGRDADYGAFELRKSWDPLGNLVEESCWGASAEPIECDHTGFHVEKLVSDDAGRTRSVRYFGQSGETATNLGVAVRRYSYDNYDHIRQIDGFDESGDVVEALGMASQRRLYDSGHRLFALLLFDRSGKPAHYSGCFTGRDCPARDWHAVRIFRGDNGHTTRNEYFDADGQLVETLDCDSQRCW
jgi:hypothetical protein